MSSKKHDIRRQATPGCPWAVIRRVKHRDGRRSWKVVSCHRSITAGRTSLAQLSRGGSLTRTELYNVNSGKVHGGFGK